MKSAAAEAKIPKMQMHYEARARWREWVKAGKEPSLEECRELILSALGEERGPTVVEKMYREPDGRLGQNISFLIWDMVENAKQELDYSGVYSYANDLLSQAQEYVSGTYATVEQMIEEANGKIVRHRVSLSTHIPGIGQKDWVDLTPKEKEIRKEHIVTNLYFQLVRWGEVEHKSRTEQREVLKKIDAKLLASETAENKPKRKNLRAKGIPTVPRRKKRATAE